MSISELTKTFISTNAKSARPVVLVTSGGTSVALEKNCVRSLENFSTGSRGAASAERFLESGYAVIFLCREGSLMPYARVLGRELNRGKAGVSVDFCNNLFGPMVKDNGDDEDYSNLTLSPKLPSSITPAILSLQKSKQTLLIIPFTTVQTYLTLLEQTSQLLKPCGRNCVLYLCAAVSDFYVPTEKMVEHKIQSNGQKDQVAGTINLELYPVPKMLSKIKGEGGWCPEAFVVSFKLETDLEILIKKAKGSITSYNVDLVIANLLQTRMETVTFVTRTSDLGDDEVRWNEEIIHRNSHSTAELEVQIIQLLISHHYTYISINGYTPVNNSANFKAVVNNTGIKRYILGRQGRWREGLGAVWGWVGPVIGIGLSWYIRKELSKRIK